MFEFSPFIVFVVPALLLLMAFMPRALTVRYASALPRVAGILTLLSFASALVAAVLVATGGTIQHQFMEVGMVHLGIYFDALSATFLLLISFLGAIIARYARNYLAGDPGIGRFFKWLCVTTGAALLLVISGNLLMFTLAWMAMSLSLHKLLTFYPDRPAALLAARKKFVISRLGDACLLGVIVLTYQQFGTWDFEALFAGAENLAAQGAAGQTPTLSAISLLLVAGAMLKSAQFPFHTWLPDTMETPTPVSALMHAGIINAGGILIIRLSPLVSLTPVALNVLTIVGAFTALFAAIVMTAQTSVKRSLAFSTVAQMGFMMLQCGLGAFSVAVLHMVGHSLYKAFAFLSSGSVIANSSSRAPKASPSPLLSAGALGVALLITFGMAWLLGISFRTEAGALLLGTVLMLALTHYLLSLWSPRLSAPLIAWGLLVGTATSAFYFGSHLALHHLLYDALPTQLPERGAVETVLFAALALGSVLALMRPFLPGLSGNTAWRRAFYVHATNGFYVNTLANRYLARS